MNSWPSKSNTTGCRANSSLKVCIQFANRNGLSACGYASPRNEQQTCLIGYFNSQMETEGATRTWLISEISRVISQEADKTVGLFNGYLQTLTCNGQIRANTQ